MDYSKTSKPAFNEHSKDKPEERILRGREDEDKDKEYDEKNLTYDMKGEGADKVQRGIVAERETNKWLNHRQEPPQKTDKPLPQDFENAVHNSNDNDLSRAEMLEELIAQQNYENKQTRALKM